MTMMHVAVMVDAETFLTESPSLQRTCVAMITKGFRVSRILPQLPPDSPNFGGGDSRRVDLGVFVSLDVPLNTPRWFRPRRLRRLMSAFDGSIPDVVLVRGAEAWTTAAEFAHAINRPLVVESWRAEDARPLRRLVSRGDAAMVIAPTRSLTTIFRRGLAGDQVAFVPGATSIPPEPTTVFSEDRAVGIAIAGLSSDVDAYASVFAALARVLESDPREVLVFLELHGPAEQAIWKAAGERGLHDRISTYQHAHHHSELISQCDLLLQPERSGRLRPVLMAVMASGVPVIAAQDPAIDFLADGHNVDLVDDPTSTEGWVTPLTKILSDPEVARESGMTARSRIARGHRSSQQVERLDEVLRGVCEQFSEADAVAKGDVVATAESSARSMNA